MLRCLLSRAPVAFAFVATLACRETKLELPEVAQKWPAPAEMTPPPPPMTPDPIRPVVLSDQENAAARGLAQRGALVQFTDLADGPQVHVTFPGGELVRDWRRQEVRPLVCGLGVAREIEPADTDLPMTDRDLTLLESLTMLKWVDLSGTQVTRDGVALLRKKMPRVEVIWENGHRPPSERWRRADVVEREGSR